MEQHRNLYRMEQCGRGARSALAHKKVQKVVTQCRLTRTGSNLSSQDHRFPPKQQAQGESQPALLVKSVIQLMHLRPDRPKLTLNKFCRPGASPHRSGRSKTWSATPYPKLSID